MNERPGEREANESIGDPTGVTRRRLLAGGAAVAVAGLSGCLGTRDGPVPAPEVTSDRIDNGWRLFDESESTVFEQAYGPVTVTALEHTNVYEYVSVAEALSAERAHRREHSVEHRVTIERRPCASERPAVDCGADGRTPSERP